MSERRKTGNGNAAEDAGRGIAIIGLEGSGKTVFLAALTQAMQDNEGFPYLDASGNEAASTRRYVAKLWDTIQLGTWPHSTNMGTLHTLTWTWHSAADAEYTVWLPDCAGQDIRQIFEGGGEDEHQKRLAADIFASGHVLVLFNLKELIDLHDVPGMNDRRVNAETAVGAVITRLDEEMIPYSVLLTQYDAYGALIKERFGDDLPSAIRHYSKYLWRIVDQCEPKLLPVSAAETEDRIKDCVAGRYPVVNTKPHPSVMEVAHAINVRLLEEEEEERKWVAESHERAIQKGQERRALQEQQARQQRILQEQQQTVLFRTMVATVLSVVVAGVLWIFLGNNWPILYVVMAAAVGFFAAKLGILTGSRFKLAFFKTVLIAAAIAFVFGLVSCCILRPIFYLPKVDILTITAPISAAVLVVMISVWKWARNRENNAN